MTKRHLKRLAAPKEWPITRKTVRFVTRAKGQAGIPLGVVLRDLLGYVSTLKEAKSVLRHKTVLVDSIKRTDVKYAVGIMDSICFSEVNSAFRMVLGNDKKLRVIKIPEEEAFIKVCKIENKRAVKGGRIQLNLHDGSNIVLVVSDKEVYKTGDSLLLTLPKREIKNAIKLEKGALVYLIGGSHAGSVGKVEGVDSQRLIIKLGNNTIETLKKFSIAIGTEKPLCRVMENG